MTHLEPIAAGKGGVEEPLFALVDNAAMQIVLGTLDGSGQFALLQRIREYAKAAGRADVADIVSATVDTVSQAIDTTENSPLFSDCIKRVQHALSNLQSASTSLQAESVPSGSPSVPLGEDRELLGDFILESRDHLTQVESQMITLEKNPEDSEAINTVFRAFHTIKGLAGFLGLDDMREIAHETETLLDLARNHKLTISPAVVDIVLAATDFLKASLLNLEHQLSGGLSSAALDKDGLLSRISSASSGTIEPLISGSDLDLNPPGQPSEQPVSCGEGTVPERRKGEDRRANATDGNCVRVGTAKLDYLVDMAGELVIAESMVRHHPELAQLHSPAVLNSLSQLARITSELQKTAMSMRMVPIGGLFQKMNRLIRDLARKTGKRVELEAIGSDTELDRNVVEELADPLMHMVRNAVDHGLESEKDRIASGKAPVGRVRLRAGHQAGHIAIEIADDGRGLNRDRILEKARNMSLLEDATNLSDTEVFNLIFHPGFSTAAEVTDVSGRGVGMDVVKKRIQKLRGHVEIESSPGRGTTFCLRLPLTLAIIDGLVVGVGCERYVVPIFSVREMLRPTPEMIFTVEGAQEMALVRNKLLPLVRLYKRFDAQPHSEDPCESLLIVAEVAGRSFCLMVDDLIGKQEVVIKSLGESIKDIPGIAGGAILGDGRVGLILDLEGVFHGGAK